MQHRRAVAAAIAGLAVAGLAVTSGPGVGVASSHREAPLIAAEPQLDNTDVYAFVSPDRPDTVTFVANWIPFEEPNGGPNFYPFAENTAYDINIDNDGDARPDITYRWTFRSFYRNQNTFLYNTNQVTSLNDPDLNFNQRYTLQRITRGGTKTLLYNAPVAPSDTGRASMPNYAALSNAAISTFGRSGSKSFAGQADDPFFLDLRVFDLLYGGNLSEVGQDTLKGYNVNSIALQVPKSDLALRGNSARNPVVGVWSTTSRPRVRLNGRDGNQYLSGDYVQVSRLGMPLVNEVVVPVGSKDLFNASKPKDDARFLPKVQVPEVPQLIQSIYGIPAPATPRQDLVEVFLTGVCKACGPVAVDLNSQKLNKDADPARFRPAEMLRLNMSVAPAAQPKRLGVLAGDVAGFPNGRRLSDDVVDVTLQAAEGVLLPGHPKAAESLGDAVNANDSPLRASFPYLALPHDSAVNRG
jgi:Domain of unknown function (DUF4331)